MPACFDSVSGIGCAPSKRGGIDTSQQEHYAVLVFRSTPYPLIVALALLAASCGSRVGLADMEPDAGADVGADADAVSDTTHDIDAAETDAGCTEAALRCWPWPDGDPDDAYGPGSPIPPLQTVACAAFRDDGTLATGSVVLSERPDGSTTSFAPELEDTSAPIFLDVVGEYVVEAVLDAPGALCELATARFDVAPAQELYVELTWTTPGDPDETDEGPRAGSDLSLHLLHPSGCWFDPAWDVFDPAQSVTWGDPDDPADDGRLLQRDDNGAGPEAAAVGIDDGASLSVGVAYVDDHGFGTARATVRVYEQAELARELTLVLDPGDFWAAMTRGADGEWTGDRIVGTLASPPPCR